MGWLRCCSILLFILCFLSFAFGRIHKLPIKNDSRKNIRLSTFGFFKNGILDVNLMGFHAENRKPDDVFGFSLERAMNEAMDPYIDLHREKCLLEDTINQQSASTSAAAFFIMDFKNKQLIVNCSEDFVDLPIFINASEINNGRSKRDSFSDMSLIGHQRMVAHDRRKEVAKREMKSTNQTCKGLQQIIPITALDNDHFSTSFAILIAQNKEEGLYNLYFHNCPNYGEERVSIDFTIKIEERNEDNFLSAGEMPLPALFFMMSILFFLSGCFWVFILVKSKHTVFKIHYLMTVLVYLKSLSLLFHAINYHFIQTRGEHVAAWAILYYITHLLKGSVLFITIILIGTGWNFIKHLLSNRDKKIFMIVIPLQVLANVANVIIEESEEGDAEHKTWADVFMLVDLLCCGAILFPVVWSIRHLQEASHTDGKAAINLRKLKLFRHFYIMVVGYIYFTRIIVYLLQMTVSFKYKYLDDMFREMVTYVFYVLTGYKFRPASPNPYFQVNTDEDDDPEMDTVVTQCGVTEGLSKLSRITKEEVVEEEKESLLFPKRESSHEYD